MSNYNDGKKCYSKISYHKYKKEFNLLIDHSMEWYESNKISINSISVTECIKKNNDFRNILTYSSFLMEIINSLLFSNLFTSKCQIVYFFLNNNALISFGNFKNE